MNKNVNEVLKIVQVKRSKKAIYTSLKVYGKVLSGDVLYNFGYFRRKGFRGWMCSCESFFFNRFQKNRNCKHLRFVRAELGRYGGTVK